ncbi:MAG: HlyC/CorC family transporter [Deltaproteobacteria bacterium]|nr:HlyC/CorC family transporter [Deltaproteobacteria bacterium]
MNGLLLGIVTAVVSEAFFSGSEIAMVSANRLHLKSRASDDHRGEQLALDLLEREDRLISTCLIGTNISTITGTTLTALVVLQLGLSPAFALLYVPVTVILGEALPKTIFQHHASVLAPILAFPLRWAQTLFLPLLGIAGLWSSTLRRLIGAEAGLVTRAEIVQMLDDGTAEIDPEEHRMIRNLFELPEVEIEDCMTPLVEVHMLPVSAAVASAVDLAVRCGHSRIPVYQGRVDNIVGLLRITELLFDAADEQPIDGLMHPVRFVPESKAADDLLHEMRRNYEHFVVVVDEYGGSVGVVTIEDLLEEFIGEIHDERDEQGPGIRRVGEGTWRLPGRTEIDALAEAIAWEVPEGDYETVAGLILAELGRIPRSGEVCHVGGLTFRVEEATDRAIVSVHLTAAPGTMSAP